jgi:hypothetical protein
LDVKIERTLSCNSNITGNQSILVSQQIALDQTRKLAYDALVAQ